jgi:hypothetical protein
MYNNFWDALWEVEVFATKIYHHFYNNKCYAH